MIIYGNDYPDKNDHNWEPIFTSGYRNVIAWKHKLSGELKIIDKEGWKSLHENLGFIKRMIMR